MSEEKEFEGRDPSRAIEVQKKEELKTVDPKLQEAHAALSDYDKVMVARGYKTFKKRGSEYKLVDNNPYEPKVTGPKFTPKKKKRKK